MEAWGEHHALGKAGGSAGVLHVHHVAGVQLGLAGGVFCIVDHAGQPQHLGHGVHAAVFFLAQKEDPLQIRESLGMQPAPLVAAQLWRQIVQGLAIIGVAKAVDEEDVLCLGVLQQIAQLLALVVGVHGEQHGADARGGELQSHPVGHVGGPDGHFFAFLHAQGHQPLGQVVHQLAELFVGEPKIPVHVDNGVVVREPGDGLVQQRPREVTVV